MKYRLHNEITKSITIIVLLVVTILSLIFSGYIFYLQFESAGSINLTIAENISHNQTIIDYLKYGNNYTAAKDIIDSTSKSGSYYIVIANKDNIRQIHPIDSLIGTPADTTLTLPQTPSEAYYSFDYTGSQGDALKSIHPIMDNNQLIGYVVVGTENDIFYSTFLSCLSIVLFSGIFVVFISSFGSNNAAKRIRKLLLNHEPEDIIRITQEIDIALNSINEGVLFFDANSNLTQINKAARNMLSYQENTSDSQNIYTTFSSHKNIGENSTVKYNNVEYYIDQNEIVSNNKRIATVFTIKPKSALFVFAEELTGVKNYMNAVRAQVHEFRNTIHTISGLIDLEKYDSLKSYVENIVINKNSESLELDFMINDYILTAFLHSKYSRSKELGVKFTVASTSQIPEIESSEQLYDIITILGNLIENAFESFSSDSLNPTVVLKLDFDCETQVLSLTIKDNGTGIDGDIVDRIYQKDVTTKGNGHGTGLYTVINCINRNNGMINNYSSELGTTFTVHIQLKERIAYGD